MKKCISIILVLIMFICLLGGCSNNENTPSESEAEQSAQETPEQTAKGAQVAICIAPINHPVHRIVQMGFVQRAEELGMDGIVSGLDDGSMQENMAKYESAVTNGAQGILLWTGDDTYYNMMKSLKEVGVYIVVPHFAHNYNDTKGFIDKNITALAAEYGEEAAKFVLDALAEKGVTNGSIGITQAGANVTENAASDAFRSYILNSGTGFTVIDTVFEGGEVTEATAKITAIIASNPDIVAGFGTTGGSCQSWAAAMENTGRTDIVMLGVDYTELNLNLIAEGRVSGIIAQPLISEAGKSAEALYALLSGETFNGSAETWQEVLEAPIVTADGEGENGLDPYYDIIKQTKEYYGR